MGIKGLLPLLGPATERLIITEQRFDGCRVAIDGDGLLYKAAYAYAVELAFGHATNGPERFVLNYVTRLQNEWRLEPVLVFDGERAPLKFDTQEGRRIDREKRRRIAAMLMLDGHEEEASNMLMRCMNVSGRVKKEVIIALGAVGIRYLVAPFEADSQLAFMSRQGEVDYVISEDSDLLVFGCERVLFKFNINSGQAELVTRARLLECISQWFPIHQAQSPLNDTVEAVQERAANVFQLFRWMCVLGGCDYLPNLPGIGLAKSRRLVVACASEAVAQGTSLAVNRLLALMPVVLGVQAPNDYEMSFRRALSTFDTQPVYDSLSGSLVKFAQ